MPGRTRKFRGVRSRQRRSRYTRARGKAKIKTIAWKKPTAMNQKVQIFSLQKQVNTLRRKTKQAWQYTKFDFPMLNKDLLPPVARSTEDTDSFNVFPILQPNAWEEQGHLRLPLLIA